MPMQSHYLRCNQCLFTSGELPHLMSESNNHSINAIGSHHASQHTLKIVIDLTNYMYTSVQSAEYKNVYDVVKPLVETIAIDGLRISLPIDLPSGLEMIPPLPCPRCDFLLTVTQGVPQKSHPLDMNIDSIEDAAWRLVFEQIDTLQINLLCKKPPFSCHRQSYGTYALYSIRSRDDNFAIVVKLANLLLGHLVGDDRELLSMRFAHPISITICASRPSGKNIQFPAK